MVATNGIAYGSKAEYFRLTLVTSLDSTPQHFLIISRQLEQQVRPNIADLKTALVHAYIDGPKVEECFA